MSRRLELIEELKLLRENGRTPRIDTVNNRLIAAQRLFAMAQEEIGDLHVLAYERQTAHRELVVNGGDRDYALDTHGDPKARAAYKQLSLATIDAIEILSEAAHDTICTLRDGDRQRPRTPRTIKVGELAEALEAQARRAINGDYTPVRRELQPEADEANAFIDRLHREARLRKERDQARTEVKRLLAELNKLDPAPQRETA